MTMNLMETSILESNLGREGSELEWTYKFMLDEVLFLYDINHHEYRMEIRSLSMH